MTGFKPYSNFKRNPSGEIAELLDGSHFKGKEVVGITLEVKHSVIEKRYLMELKKEYEIIINTGIGPGRNVIGIEKIAVNWQGSTKDEEGSSRDGKIAKDAPDGIFTRLPVEEILHSLRSAKIPSEISFSAGTFLCNKILYCSLYYSTARAGFIHFPLDSESSLDGKYPSMIIDNMIKSVELAIQKTI
ncbi:MAG: pyroglutamyl-peptidase I [Thermoplasmatales archaeon]|nr:pyroglutamyl-peptidase I [Candidatus Thermoplasmatota archaeon]MCL6002112.1 pyroglutamyl-peptidase I [Candidatus Thermoplasmatota archaeon]MDA8055279.1 pyroglutamyl-peptidase I [Thermoplasmatales archaeon]